MSKQALIYSVERYRSNGTVAVRVRLRCSINKVGKKMVDAIAIFHDDIIRLVLVSTAVQV